MALMKLSAIGITALSGASDGSVFSHNRGGKYVRNWAKPTNPQTSAQTLMRSIFGSVSQAWGQLTDDEVKAWQAAAANFTKTNAIGDDHAMTGFTYFQQVNFNNIHSGLAVDSLTLPPAVLPTPGVLLISEFTVDLASGGSASILELNLDSSVPASTYVASFGFAVVPAGKNRGYGTVKNQFYNLRVRKAIPSGTAINLDDTDLAPVIGAVSESDKVYFQLHIHGIDGSKGNPITGETVVIDTTP
jgi:hypothetical protein